MANLVAKADRADRVAGGRQAGPAASPLQHVACHVFVTDDAAASWLMRRGYPVAVLASMHPAGGADAAPAVMATGTRDETIKTGRFPPGQRHPALPRRHAPADQREPDR